MNAKMSIIIPAYNAERTLNETLDSVRRQTLAELEIWVVDDGSSDATGRIADEAAVQDSRVHVIHQENQGTFRARMSALKRITAPYFGFVDADDVIEPNMYERLLAFAQENQLDVAQSELWGCAKPGAPDLFLTRAKVERVVVIPWLFEGRGMALVWDKIYRRECADTEFEVSYYSTYEDLILNMHFFQKVRRFGLLHEGFYHYQPNDLSTTRNFSMKNVRGFAETIRVRTMMAERYGLCASDSMFCDWVAMNAKNQLRLATMAPVANFSQRMENVRALLEIPEVQKVVESSSDEECARFVRSYRSHPIWATFKTRVLVTVINLMLKAKECVSD